MLESREIFPAWADKKEKRPKCLCILMLLSPTIFWNCQKMNLNLWGLISQSYTKPGTVLQNLSSGFLQRKEYNHIKAFFSHFFRSWRCLWMSVACCSFWALLSQDGLYTDTRVSELYCIILLDTKQMDLILFYIPLIIPLRKYFSRYPHGPVQK